MKFRDLITEVKEDSKAMKKKANTIATEMTLPGEEYDILDGLDKGKVGVIAIEDSDLESWERYPEIMVFDENTNEYTISTNTNKTAISKGKQGAWKLFKEAFYGGYASKEGFYGNYVDTGNKKLSSIWK